MRDAGARAVVGARHAVVLVWLVLAAAAWALLPGGAAGGGLGGFVPAHNAVARTERAAVEAFGFPLISRTVVVQRDPGGLSASAQAEVVRRAADVTGGQDPAAGPVRGALPVLNTLGLFPSSSEVGTTALTYLYMDPDAGIGTQTRAARAFAAERVDDPSDALVGVTGSVPARVAQGRILRASLPAVEAGTVAVVALVVGVAFRSVVAPLVALAAAGVAFTVTIRLTGWAGQLLGVPIPSELEPLVVALVLGVVTDYAVFFLSGLRRQLSGGVPRLAAARAATAEHAPVVIVAGITVAASSASLLVVRSGFFRPFGPAMALAVLVSLAVSVTLVPALLALLGRAALWPARLRPAGSAAPRGPAGRLRALHGGSRAPRGPRTLPVAVVATRRRAAAVALASTAVLGLAAAPVQDLRLGVGFVPSLPPGAQARAAASAASEGFAPGIVSPTVLLLRGQDLAAERGALARLGQAVAHRSGVAGVVGPGDLPAELELHALVSASGDAARYLVVLQDDPLGARAVATLERLQGDLPSLLRGAGLAGVDAGLAGDTALAADLVSSTSADLGRMAAAVLAIDLLLLVVFLRALVAPLYLLACTVLALGASLGLTTLLFQGLLGHDGITFYVPLAAGVLLLSLGSDYTVFGVGHIWSLARTRPLRQAIAEAVPRTTSAITTAGLTLAASFAVLAVVPLRPFRELAVVMAVGILLDALVVRSLLVPSLLSLVGARLSSWPSHRLARRQGAGAEEAGGAGRGGAGATAS